MIYTPHLIVTLFCAAVGILLSPIVVIFILRTRRITNSDVGSVRRPRGLVTVGILVGLVLICLPQTSDERYDIHGLPVPVFVAVELRELWTPQVLILAVPVDLLWGVGAAHMIAWLRHRHSRRPPRPRGRR